VSVRLWTFQPLVRVAELERAGRMTGSWEWVSPGFVSRSYRAMVAARAGIDTDGRPPVWAWSARRRVSLGDAADLLGEYGLLQGCATVEFAAPTELCLASDYGAWNDYQYELHRSGAAPAYWDVPCPLGQRQVQVCLPELRAEWVRAIRPLPGEITAAERSRPA
jgi:hypothetical protein